MFGIMDTRNVIFLFMFNKIQNRETRVVSCFKIWSIVEGSSLGLPKGHLLFYF